MHLSHLDSSINEKLILLAGGISSRMKKNMANVQLDERLSREAAALSKSMICVGEGNRPFLDYLLYNARSAGYNDITIVIGERDQSLREHYGMNDRDNHYHGLMISYAVQRIPQERTKPLGTADALLQGLCARRDWAGSYFTVCNSDNLYSVEALAILSGLRGKGGMIEYDRDTLGFDASRIEQFAVVEKNDRGYLKKIIEKPLPEEIVSLSGGNKHVGVSMNIFRLSYDLILPFLETVPLHVRRNEKELPQAIEMMIACHPEEILTIPLAELVPDLTQKDDILKVREYLQEHFPDFSMEQTG